MAITLHNNSSPATYPLAWILDNNCQNFMLGDIIMDVQSVMWIEMATGQGIRCRMVKEGFMLCSYVFSMEDLMLKIEKSKPDVVVMDLNLYERMDGIETSRKIRNRFDVPVVYV